MRQLRGSFLPDSQPVTPLPLILFSWERAGLYLSSVCPHYLGQGISSLGAFFFSRPHGMIRREWVLKTQILSLNLGSAPTHWTTSAKSFYLLWALVPSFVKWDANAQFSGLPKIIGMVFRVFNKESFQGKEHQWHNPQLCQSICSCTSFHNHGISKEFFSFNKR